MTQPTIIINFGALDKGTNRCTGVYLNEDGDVAIALYREEIAPNIVREGEDIILPHTHIRAFVQRRTMDIVPFSFYVLN